MTSANVIIPAQIRAARALLEWSQEKLATEAKVGLSTVRDVESQKRALDTAAATEITRVLQNAGVSFIPGTDKEGPGVRFGKVRPHIIRPPTTKTMWDGLPFGVEWQGNVYTVFLSEDALDDLGQFRVAQPNAAYLAVFETFRGRILDAAADALAAGRADEKSKLRLRSNDFFP